MHDGIAKSGGEGNRAPLVIWTRSAADLATDRALLDQHKVEIIHVPCIRSEAIARGMSELRDALRTKETRASSPLDRWLILTSQNAVKTLIKLAKADSDFKLALRSIAKVITHGRQTAAAARPLFEDRIECLESPTSEQLATKIAGELGTGGNKIEILWPCAEESAFDVAGRLVADGQNARRIPVYRTVAAPSDDSGEPLDQAACNAKAGQIAARVQNVKCVICFASPSAVEGWLRLTRNTPALSPRYLTAAVIGPTTGRAAAAAAFGNIVVSAWPDLQDLISLGASCAGPGGA